MARSSDRHEEAAARHERVAATHERAAVFWEQQGNRALADLHRDTAAHERMRAALDRRWADLIAREDAGGLAAEGAEQVAASAGLEDVDAEAEAREIEAEMRETEMRMREHRVDMREQRAGARESAADVRDRVADERDRQANDRETVADRRERLADAREGTAEAREIDASNVSKNGKGANEPRCGERRSNWRVSKRHLSENCTTTPPTPGAKANRLFATPPAGFRRTRARCLADARPVPHRHDQRLNPQLGGVPPEGRAAGLGRPRLAGSGGRGVAEHKESTDSRSSCLAAAPQGAEPRVSHAGVGARPLLGEVRVEKLFDVGGWVRQEEVARDGAQADVSV
jgi:hypothetical protein